MKRLILTDNFSQTLGDVAAENSVELEGSPLDFLDFAPSLKS
jgi:hypothetical protein